MTAESADIAIFGFAAATVVHAVFATLLLLDPATLRNLELIGEAATHVPDEIRAAHPEIPWRMIIATRNRLIHGYLGIDDDTLWSIIRVDVPEILPPLQALRHTVEQQ